MKPLSFITSIICHSSFVIRHLQNGGNAPFQLFLQLPQKDPHPGPRPSLNAGSVTSLNTRDRRSAAAHNRSWLAEGPPKVPMHVATLERVQESLDGIIAVKHHLCKAEKIRRRGSRCQGRALPIQGVGRRHLWLTSDSTEISVSYLLVAVERLRVGGQMKCTELLGGGTKSRRCSSLV